MTPAQPSGHSSWEKPCFSKFQERLLSHIDFCSDIPLVLRNSSWHLWDSFFITGPKKEISNHQWVQKGKDVFSLWICVHEILLFLWNKNKRTNEGTTSFKSKGMGVGEAWVHF